MPAIILLVLWVGLIVGIFSGWVMNIMNILSYDTIEMSGTFIIQIIGIIVFPIGGIAGWVV